MILTTKRAMTEIKGPAATRKMSKWRMYTTLMPRRVVLIAIAMVLMPIMNKKKGVLSPRHTQCQLHPESLTAMTSTLPRIALIAPALLIMQVRSR